MKHSEQINELASSLAKAQGEMQPAAFDRKNPHFNSRYATLTSIMESVRAPLSKHGLSISQALVGSGEQSAVVTTIFHASGQWLSDDGIPLILDKSNMQGLGSAITYAKRYGISALLAIVSDEDTDGEDIKVESLTVATPAATAVILPSCCNKTMMISKQNSAQLYCVLCKKTQPRAV